MYPTSNLQPGMTGSEVKKLQDYLVKSGYMTQSQVNTGYGIYGPQTTAAVKSLQQSLGIDNSSGPGYWGPKTIAAIQSSFSPTTTGAPIPSRNLSFAPSPAPTNVTAPQETSTPTNQQLVDQYVKGGGRLLSAQQITGYSAIDKYIEDAIGAVVSSGKTIPETLTVEDLKDLDTAEFMRQAEAMIVPEYKEKFQVIKDSLTRDLTNIGYDLTKKIEDNARITQENLETGQEELAGRGLAFSGQRTKFETDTEAARTRADESARNLSLRSGQEKFSTAEGQIGTSALGGFNVPQVGGQSLQLSSAPLVGSLNRESQYLKESMSQELQRQERERRSYVSRNLSFA